MSPADWQSIMQGITQNIASYQPIMSRWTTPANIARAMKTSNIAASQYNPASGQVSATFSGKSDIATKFYLFTDNAGSIQQTLVDVPAFDGATQVSYTIPNAVTCDPATTNPIVCENAKPGNPASEWDVSGAGDPTIQGFATDISVDQGQTVHFKVNTDANDYRLDIYRMGYYGGLGRAR